MAGPALMPIFIPASEKFQLMFSGSDSGQVVTFEDVPFGPASADRKIIVPIGATNGSSAITLESVTIGGVTADIDIQRDNSGNSRNGHAAVASATVPTGTSGDIVVSWGGGTHVTVIAAIRGIGLASSSVHDTAPDGEEVGDPDMSLGVPAYGLVVAANAVITADATWSTGVDLILSAAGESGDNSSVAWRAKLAEDSDYSVVSSGGSGGPSRYACASYG